MCFVFSLYFGCSIVPQVFQFSTPILSLTIYLSQVVLCFSPVGSTLRVRGRKFPAIVNCTSIDWFHEWPEEALTSVSHRFLSEMESELISVSLQFHSEAFSLNALPTI